MQDISAIILAAGRGIRMGPGGALLPKGMIRLGNIPLLRASIANLRAVGVKHIRIVTGHLSEMIAAEFADTDTDIELIYNSAFAETGSLNSLIVGLHGITSPVILLECDILYEKRGLDPLLGGETGIVLSGITNATDEVYVWAKQNSGNPPQLLSMSKDINFINGNHFGELVGITSFAASDLEELNSIGQTLFKSDPRMDYEPLLTALAQHKRFDCHLISDLVWAEIDDELMLDRVKTDVWPKLLAKNLYGR